MSLSSLLLTPILGVVAILIQRDNGGEIITSIALVTKIIFALLASFVY